jgi:hypothetical protein
MSKHIDRAKRYARVITGQAKRVLLRAGEDTECFAQFVTDVLQQEMERDDPTEPTSALDRTHQHVDRIFYDANFVTCANPENCVPTAHGGVSIFSLCACGATRIINCNLNMREMGVWTRPPQEGSLS